MNSNIVDNVRNYFGSSFPDEVALDQAYLHMGVFMGWVIKNDFYSDDYEDEYGAQIIHFMNNEISPIILAETLDGIIDYSLFRETLKPFVRTYYGGGQYLADYQHTLSDGLNSMFHVKDSWENFDAMKSVISDRYQDWLSS
ncbi:DUF7832 domain-containing protein [Flammeovirga aprica]|uniref:DUF7832 domain-containing protein n=1 Tax=Flammeovirga aprica JL-4 TaxID=694437 RepID=A0A7X9P024_9BACT|nr:hypothetical protein [Flammeovirga aprica]NME67074.1 hypothetical protein [Flammeovirga aprica JL-4]